ncbi:hypothetical protein CLF_100428 [Clonorchis sinensis]|uniref:ZSWIM1/3 RNaseH-like domain-containing protein n=1 Tax=Clonorchis sinensis TaxID=79923 RepID=G7Y3F4_CLOSI|nr:hypothetical protein CLF_100428 [Clonorchis sinensis]
MTQRHKGKAQGKDAHHFAFDVDRKWKQSKTNGNKCPVRLFAKYGDAVQADSTYQGNRGGYHLWHVVITDCNCVGRSVFYSFIRNESQECYDVAVEHFVRMMCPVNVVRTIVVDKSKSQLCSLKTAMPDAAVIFCSFHVIQSFKAKSNKLMEVTQSDKKFCLPGLREWCIVGKSASSSSYATSIRSRNQEFWSYLSEQWLTDLSNRAKHAVTLGNETTNRVESAKRCVSAISECLGRLTPYAQERVSRNHKKSVELAHSTHSYLVFRDGNQGKFDGGNVSRKFVNYNKEGEIMGFKEEPTILPEFMAYSGSGGVDDGQQDVYSTYYRRWKPEKKMKWDEINKA